MKRIAIVVILASLVVAVFQYQSLLTGYARFFVVDNATPGADAILVLGGNNLTRVPKAVELLERRFASRLLLTSLRPVKRGFESVIRSNADQARAIATHLSAGTQIEIVPSTKGGATSTFDEAYDLLEYARREELGRVIIVTDGFHTRRALMAFRKVLGDSQIEVEAAAAPNDHFDQSNWWRSDLGLSAYIIEPVKFLVYLFTSRNVEGIANN